MNIPAAAADGVPASTARLRFVTADVDTSPAPRALLRPASPTRVRIAAPGRRRPP